MRMKTFGKLSIAFLMLMLLTAVVSAQSGLPGSGWYVNAVIQNVDTVNGNISLEAFPLNGVATGGGSASTALASGASVTFRADNPGTAGTIGIPAVASAAFQGSMIVSSDVKVVSTAFVNNLPIAGTTLGVTGGKASGAYRGVPQGGTSLSFPVVKTGFNGRSTSFFVQAAGAAAQVDISYKANDGTTYILNDVNIEANKTYVLLPSNLRNGTTPPPASCTSANGPSCLGSITVTSSAPIAGTAVEYPTTGSPAAVALSTNMLTPGNAGIKLACSTVKHKFPNGSTDPSSGVGIQNVSASPQNITITIVTRAPSVATYTHTFNAVPAGGSVVASATAGTVGGMPAGAVGSATITSAGNVVATVSESRGADSAGIYYCPSSTEATVKLAIPVIKFVFPNATSGANTGVNLQNVGTAATNITGQFTCRNSSGTISRTIVKSGVAAGASVAFGPFTDLGAGANQIPAGNLCSAVFTATQPIVGIANESIQGTSSPVRDASVYEAFNLN